MKFTQAMMISGLLAATPALAQDRVPQHIGVGSGAVLGGLIAGPVGAAVGATFGNFLGLDKIQANQLAETETARDVATAQLEQRKAELATLNQQIERQQTRLAAMTALVEEVPMALLFETESAQLADQYVPMLEALAEASRVLPDLRIRLEGHADQRGPADANQALSEARAAVVSDELVQQGAPSVAVSWQGFGEQAAQGRNQIDRRVDLKLEFESEGQSLFSAN